MALTHPAAPVLCENIHCYRFLIIILHNYTVCFNVIFVISHTAAKLIAGVEVLEVMKCSVLGSRLRNDDTIWTLYFKLILTEISGFDFPHHMAGMKRTVIHISRPKDPQRDLGIKRYEPLN